MNKGINLLIREFKEKLVADINEAQLPISIIDLTLKDISRDIEKVVIQQVEIEKADYNKQVEDRGDIEGQVKQKK